QQDEVNRRQRGPQDAPGVMSSSGRENEVAPVRKQHVERIAGGLIVLDQQDRGLVAFGNAESEQGGREEQAPRIVVFLGKLLGPGAAAGSSGGLDQGCSRARCEGGPGRIRDGCQCDRFLPQVYRKSASLCRCCRSVEYTC